MADAQKFYPVSPTQPVEDQPPCSQPEAVDDEEFMDVEDIDSSEDWPAEPDLEWYFDHYDLDDARKVAISRTFASYLVAKGSSGRMRPGPAPGNKRSRD